MMSRMTDIDAFRYRFGYKTSKFALEKPNIITISMCPGWVQTGVSVYISLGFEADNVDDGDY